ncbi:MAG: monovalent cation/H(+) antiporter subunit G [Longimicrobiales bacterium]
MAPALDVIAAGLLLLGAYFFVAGTVGILRFPDVYTRLHALTKADALGLGFIALGLCFRAGSWAVRLQLILTWLLVLAATATVAHLLARTSMEEGIEPVARPRKEVRP